MAAPTAQLVLVVGLGNPGARYAQNRHNVGFHAIDAIVCGYDLRPAGTKFSSECFQGEIAGTRVLALKPHTFMNKSGQAVGEAARFYKIPPASIHVIHDELDLEPMKLRIKQGGGAGGHNGLRDIDRTIGADYWRLRLGIGHPGDKDRVHDYVLSDFRGDEAIDFDRWVTQLAKEFPLYLEQGASAYMNKMALLG